MSVNALCRWISARGESRIRHLINAAQLANRTTSGADWQGGSFHAEPPALAALGMAFVVEAAKLRLTPEQMAQHLDDLLGSFHYFSGVHELPKRRAAWQESNEDEVSPTMILENGTMCWEFSAPDADAFIFVEVNTPADQPRVWLNNREIREDDAEDEFKTIFVILRTVLLPNLNWRGSK
jgi:hypothetical protein